MLRLFASLDRKLLRDLWHIKTQVLAISLVMASGVATFVMSRTTLRSLEAMQSGYYERYRFADLFAPLVRAPDLVAERIEAIAGVQTVETRTVADVTLDVATMPEPGVARLISLPDAGQPMLNRLHLRRGRWLDPLGRDEVLANEVFADAHGFDPGATFDVVINGRLRTLTIVGIAMSPEYVMQLRSGDLLPDEERFGVFWMRERELNAAMDMTGAFNNVAITLAPRASLPRVVGEVDRILERYGGTGAYDRSDHLPHRYLSDEIQGLRAIGLVAPSIFLAVAAFLLNVVLSRIVRTQREQIAALRAFGYSQIALAWHYLKLVLVIVAIGLTVGTALGAWMGRGLTSMYVGFYRFPQLEYALALDVVLLAGAVAAGAAMAGTVASVLAAMRLPPAEAMRPEPPASFRATFVERLGMQRLLSPVARMVLRQLERRPVRAGLSVLGIAMAVGVLVLGRFTFDAVDYLMYAQFQLAQRQDVTVAFTDPVPGRALYELANLPGVTDVEGQRSVAARLRSGHREHLGGILGIDGRPRLQRVLDAREQEVAVPGEGLMLSETLAAKLAVAPGDVVTVEVLEDRRPVRRVELRSVVHDYAGTNAYMARDALNRLMREDRVVSSAHLRVDEAHLDAVYARLGRTPGVAGVQVRAATLQAFRDTIVESQATFRQFNLAFAVLIAFGVVYNTARVSLSERSRELATLRVLGFTRGEISRILLGELAVLTGLALPLGMVIGYGFAWVAAIAFETEMFRIPLVVRRETYAIAGLVVLLAATASGLVVRRRLDRLDLVGVLKARE